MSKCDHAFYDFVCQRNSKPLCGSRQRAEPCFLKLAESVCSFSASFGGLLSIAKGSWRSHLVIAIGNCQLPVTLDEPAKFVMNRQGWRRQVAVTCLMQIKAARPTLANEARASMTGLLKAVKGRETCCRKGKVILRCTLPLWAPLCLPFSELLRRAYRVLCTPSVMHTSKDRQTTMAPLPGLCCHTSIRGHFSPQNTIEHKLDREQTALSYQDAPVCCLVCCLLSVHC